MKRFATLSLALLSLAACTGQDLIVEELALPDVAIDPVEVHLGPGTSAQLHATVPGYPPSKPITSSVADPALAAISPAGLLTIDPCAPASTTQARGTWTAHPEKQATTNVFVTATSAARVSIQAITDAPPPFRLRSTQSAAPWTSMGNSPAAIASGTRSSR